MQPRSIVMAFIAGLTAFLTIGILVTDLAASRVEFSLFLGLPVGLVVGVLVTIGVYLSLSDDAPAQRRRVAFSVSGFGAVFLAVLMLAIGVFDIGVITALGLGVLLGIFAAAITYYRQQVSSRTIAG